jgi:predicted RNase H-like HicB family nuclease
MQESKKYTVSDGDLVLHLEPADEGGYVVTSPFDPALITQADSLDEAFELARDAAELLQATRKELIAKAQAAVTTVQPA